MVNPFRKTKPSGFCMTSPNRFAIARLSHVDLLGHYHYLHLKKIASPVGLAANAARIDGTELARGNAELVLMPVSRIVEIVSGR